MNKKCLAKIQNVNDAQRSADDMAEPAESLWRKRHEYAKDAEKLEHRANGGAHPFLQQKTAICQKRKKRKAGGDPRCKHPEQKTTAKWCEFFH